MTTTDIGTCGKCDGKGKILAYSHVDNGVCFTCGGTGKVDAAALRRLALRNGSAGGVSVTTRATWIHRLHGIISAGRSRRGAERRDWALDIVEPEACSGATLATMLDAAPADVAARARIALRELGVAV